MKIFETYNTKTLSLKNRIVMAPMTRCRAINNTPNDLMETYYEQRADAGLIISEGASPSPNGIGYARIPGAYTEEQINGWGKIAKRVQEKESKLFVQLMHCGRVTAKANLPEGGYTLAPSAIHLGGEMYTDEFGMQPHETPKEMSSEEIISTQNEYLVASEKLTAAGVDGIELHSANGYLLEQFLNPATNTRQDTYGGDFKNRARFLLEIAQKITNSIGGEKVGIRLSPYGNFNETQSDYSDLVEMYTYISEELSKLNIAYIHIVDHRAMGAPDFATDIIKTIKASFAGTIITGGGIDNATNAETVIDKGADLVYIGRPYISNPGLVDKFKNNEELNEFKADTFYTPDAVGYTDYPNYVNVTA